MPNKTAYILGAGFSNNAGIPLQNKFLRALVAKENKGTNSEKDIKDLLATAIDSYVNRFFGSNPQLEDIFTCIDLSANTGHHLGRVFSPARLRSIRRALIVRIIQVINDYYKEKNIMKQFFKNIDLQASDFIVLNWDTVVEREIIRNTQGQVFFQYGCDETTLGWEKSVSVRKDILRVNIAKVHGSIHWLYCDNCRKIFSLNPALESEIPYQILKHQDLSVLQNTKLATTKIRYRVKDKYRCSFCRTILSTRIATFSYRKVLDSPILTKSWFWAEQLLSNAREWVFIGYSLPAADYEFKYLLKRLELSDPNGKEIRVISLGGSDTYRKFFGQDNLKPKNITNKGLSEFVRRL